jgi:hypothetical protein
MNVISCPNCKLRVLPKIDGTCPSCGAVIEPVKSDHPAQSYEAVSARKKGTSPGAKTAFAKSSGAIQASEKSDKETRFCPNCGEPNLSSDKFCTKCGTPIRERQHRQTSQADSGETSDFQALHVPLEGNKKMAEVYYDQAYQYYQNSQYKKALTACEKVIELAPNWSDGHNLCGAILEDMGRLKEAIIEYKLAISLDPANQDASEHLNFALKESGKHKVGRQVVWIVVISIMSLLAFLVYEFLKDTGMLAKPAAPGKLVAWNEVCSYAETKTVVAVDGYFPYRLSGIYYLYKEYKIPFYKTPELSSEKMSVRIKISEDDFAGGSMSPNMIAELPDPYDESDFVVMAHDGTNINVGDKARLSGKIIGEVGNCVMEVSYIEAK